jgi:toxoflavin synthase
MIKAQYDKIAKDYATSQIGRQNRDYAHEPKFFEVLDNVKGKSVVDFACGDGILTRKIFERGAARVVGVDESAEIVALAKKTSPKGIEYLVGKVSQLGKIGEFDLVTGGYLFHYADTISELEAMFRDAYVNLKEGGRVVAINNHPGNPITFNKKYGTVTRCLDPELKEGAKLECTIYNGDQIACPPFTQRYWLKGTYESAIKKAGFQSFAWHELKVSPEGIKEYGENFWEDFKKNPAVIVLEVKK